MSGIGGIVYFDGRMVTLETLGSFIDVCAHRGPHGRGVWADGNVGLALRLLSPGDDEPSRPRQLDLRNGDLVVVADARLDNRRELMTALSLRPEDNSELASADLIRAAYLEWGDQCTEHLLGDFAFAIWDARAKRLFCARDHFGVRPFYYSLSERALVFASEIKSILALDEIPLRVNETRIADYLANIFLDNTSTFYDGVSRLPPGHTISVDGKTTKTRRYWALDRVEAPLVGSSEELVAYFRETFYEAVRCRLPGDRPIGVLLSGGLDSSAIAGALMELLPTEDPPRLHALSAVFETVTECDESEWVRAVLDCGQAVWHPIHGDRVGPFSDIDAMLRHHDEPYEGANLFMVWALYARAREVGIGVLMDGLDGDTTLSHGFGHLHEMAMAGRWISLARQLRGVAKTHGASPWPMLWKLYRLHALRPFMERSPWNLIGRAYGRAERAFRGSAATGTTNATQAAPYIKPELARRTHLEERCQEWFEASPDRARTGAEEHYRAITGCLQPFALEVYDRTAAAFSIETPHVFWDKRLIELSLALPAELKLHGGWSRVVLRRAMRGVLPEEVLWRHGKADFAANVRHALMSVQKDQVEKVIFDQDFESIADYVDVDLVREAHRRLRDAEGENWRRDLFALWKVVSLKLWLTR